MFKFELEKGSKKHTCPACSQKRFVRYVKRLTNEHLNSDVGRCDRESSCGYHKKPKDYFVENPTLKNGQIGHNKKSGISRQAVGTKNGTQAKQTLNNTTKTFDSIPDSCLLTTIVNYSQNSFVQFLLNLFPDCFDEVENAVKDYRIGTTKTGKTVFWQLDKNYRVRTGKIIAYDADTGKRIKSIHPNWTHTELKRQNLLKQDFNLKQCFFGEHLLRKYPDKPICIVEAEKTAVIGSICYPEYVWLAIGSKQSLKFERIKKLGRNRKIILYPDADGFEMWNKTSQKARLHGLDVTISELIQINADAKERENGYDLADYLINEKIDQLESQNEFADLYNAKLEKVLNDEKLYADFEMILDEQKAVLMVDGNVPEDEAERIITKSKNVRQIVLDI